MALNYWFDNINDYENVVWIKTGKKNDDGSDEITMNPVTHALIFATLSVGIGDITDKNIDEFVARFRIIEKLQGPFIIEDGKGRPMEDHELAAHIGLRTNVSNETRAAWVRRIFGNKQTSITDDYARAWRRANETTAWA
jgi:hypothetical protein